jgi:hypothetical protein
MAVAVTAAPVRARGWRRFSDEALEAELARAGAGETAAEEAADEELAGAWAVYADDIWGELGDRADFEPPPDSPALDPWGPWGAP